MIIIQIYDGVEKKIFEIKDQSGVNKNNSVNR